MKKRASRVLVVDACIARSAGETDHPVSSVCRKALDDMLRICHRLAWTPAIRDEWNKHASGFAWRWRAAMAARKKIVRFSPDSIILPPDLPTAQRRAIEKDLHLIECACVADGIILTRDDHLLAAWNACHEDLQMPKPILWINPKVDNLSNLGSS